THLATLELNCATLILFLCHVSLLPGLNVFIVPHTTCRCECFSPSVTRGIARCKDVVTKLDNSRSKNSVYEMEDPRIYGDSISRTRMYHSFRCLVSSF